MVKIRTKDLESNDADIVPTLPTFEHEIAALDRSNALKVVPEIDMILML